MYKKDFSLSDLRRYESSFMNPLKTEYNRIIRSSKTCRFERNENLGTWDSRRWTWVYRVHGYLQRLLQPTFAFRQKDKDNLQ